MEQSGACMSNIKFKSLLQSEILTEYFEDKVNFLFKKFHPNDPYNDPTEAFSYAN